MSVISVYASAVQTVFDDLSVQVDSIVTSQAGIVNDVAGLKATIEKLQSSPGGVTPEDQALLDSLQTQIVAHQAKVTAVAQAMKALDETTEELPPVPPVEPV